MSEQNEELRYDEILLRAGELTEQLLSNADPSIVSTTEELLDWLDVFHREGVGRLLEMVRQWRGELFLEQVALDPVVGELLATYDLGVGVDSTAILRVVQSALDEVRPYVHSHGGELEVISVEDGVVRLRMLGSCDGCSAADATVANRIDSALRDHWIGFRRVELEDPTAAPHPPPPDSHSVSGLQIGRPTP